MQRMQPDDALTLLMTSGFVTVPSLLLRHYKQLGLSEEEMVLLLHLIDFRQMGTPFPTFRELAGRMTMHEDWIEKNMLRLMQNGFIGVRENRQQEEECDLGPLYRKLADLIQPKAPPPPSTLDLLEKKDNNLFALFENEFGRPLSSMENEMIVQWLDQDFYGEEMIREALREAVLSGKYNFKYIDRILFEWGKQNIRSLQELNMVREQYRNRAGIARHGGSGGVSKSRDTAPQKPAQNTENKYDAFYQSFRRE